MSISKRKKSVLCIKKCLLITIAIILSVAVTACTPSNSSSVSDVDGKDLPQKASVENLSVSSLNELKLRSPHFFNLSTDGGLTVHIWQTAENDYRCYLVNSFTDAITDNSFAYKSGATLAEMRAILSTYDIKKEDITISPVKNPLSSYKYKIDNKYRERVKKLFWQDNNVLYTNISEVFGVDRNKIWSDALNSDKLNHKDPYHLPIYKFDTLKDFEDFKKLYEDEIDFNRDFQDDEPSFNDSTAKYNNDFFNKNSLVLIYLNAGSGMYRYDVKSIDHSTDSLLVHVVQIPYMGDVTADTADWFITVAVSDERIKSYTEFDADLNKENKKPSVEELKLKFPSYFNLDTSKGLEIYFWNTTRTHIYSGLLPTRDKEYSKLELEALSEASATMEEMRVIIYYYLEKGLITKDKIKTNLIQMPNTTFPYFAESYKLDLDNFFWNKQ